MKRYLLKISRIIPIVAEDRDDALMQYADIYDSLTFDDNAWECDIDEVIFPEPAPVIH